jgi:hypothetical protein
MSARRVRIGSLSEDGVSWLIPYHDARQDVVVERKMVDIWKGNPGVAGDCMNAQCILRNKDVFPHAVFLASVMKSRVFIVDRVTKDGEPAHAVRYILGAVDGADIARHDVLKTAVPATLTLKAPRGARRTGASSGGTTKPSGPHTTTRNSPVSRGEKARLLAAVGALR